MKKLKTHHYSPSSRILQASFHHHQSKKIIHKLHNTKFLFNLKEPCITLKTHQKPTFTMSPQCSIYQQGGEKPNSVSRILLANQKCHYCPWDLASPKAQISGIFSKEIEIWGLKSLLKLSKHTLLTFPLLRVQHYVLGLISMRRV